MSNKSRLQTNNTNLQALIDKANALPDAGSGGSETCELTITTSAMDVPLPITIYYINSQGQCHYHSAPSSTNLDGSSNSLTIEVFKNSYIIFVDEYGDGRCIEELYDGLTEVCNIMGLSGLSFIYHITKSGVVNLIY